MDRLSNRPNVVTDTSAQTKPRDRALQVLVDPAATDTHWMRRPLLAQVVTFSVAVGPALLAIAAAVLLETLVGEPAGTFGRLAWWVGVLAVAGVVLYLSGRAARRALPLAILLKMSLEFPADAPKRRAVAWRAASKADLKRHLTQARSVRLVQDPVTAVERVVALAAALSVHDRRTRGHADRVQEISDLIGRELGLSEIDRNGLRWSAMLHDVGKMVVHPGILNKQGVLTLGERDLLRRHPAEGAKLTAPLSGWLGDWSRAIIEHHEHHDGTGYPLGLEGDAISLGGQIVAVADAYDTLTSRRAYKSGPNFDSNPTTPDAARAEIARCSGTQFDPAVVRAFLAIPVVRLRAPGPAVWIGSLPFGITQPDLAALAKSTAVVLAVVCIAGLATSKPLAPQNGQVALIAPAARNDGAQGHIGSSSESSGTSQVNPSPATNMGSSSKGGSQQDGLVGNISTVVTTLEGGVARLVSGMPGPGGTSGSTGSSPATSGAPPGPTTTAGGTPPSTTGGTSPPTTRGGSPPTTKATSPPTTKPTAPPTTKPTAPPTTKPTAPPTTTGSHPAPSPPNGLNANATCQNVVIGPEVTLGWSGSSSSWVTGYSILRSSNGSNFSQIASVPAGSRSYTDSSVQGLGITYWYEVVADSSYGDTTSEEVSVTTPLICV